MNDTTTYLNIGSNYRVSRDDDRNLLLEEYKLVKSAPNRHQKEYKETQKWVNVGFYGTLHQVANRVLDETVSNNLNGKLNDIIAVIEDTKQEIYDAVNEAGIMLESFPKTVDGRGRKSVEVAKVDDTPVTKKKRGRPRKVTA
jgi:predicted DNA-binding ArsR family transcriptional regulator